MAMTVLFASIPVSQFAVSLEWYRRFFGRNEDIVAHDTEVMWQVVDGGWLYVVEDAARAGSTVVTIAVDDLDAAVADLTARGLTPGDIVPEGSAGHKSITLDPDGNQLMVIQVS